MNKEQAVNLINQVFKIYLGSRGKNFDFNEAAQLQQVIIYISALEEPKSKTKKPASS